MYQCRKALCKTCKFVQHGQKSFSTKGKTHLLKEFYNCSSDYVVYDLTCPCGLIYVGRTIQALRQRFSEHRRFIEDGTDTVSQDILQKPTINPPWDSKYGSLNRSPDPSLQPERDLEKKTVCQRDLLDIQFRCPLTRRYQQKYRISHHPLILHIYIITSILNFIVLFRSIYSLKYLFRTLGPHYIILHYILLSILSNHTVSIHFSGWCSLLSLMGVAGTRKYGHTLSRTW